jgi:hypothetical protein
MEEFKPNSYKSKEEPPKKKIEKVANGKLKKKSEIKKFTDIFVARDFSDVLSYVAGEILLPALKKAIVDGVSGGIKMLINGDASDNRSSGSPASKVYYSSYYKGGSSTNPSCVPNFNSDEVVFTDLGEARNVLTRMNEVLSIYQVVSVSDFYDLVGVTGPYTGNNYGWTDLRTATIVNTSDGYVIKLPKAMPLH